MPEREPSVSPPGPDCPGAGRPGAGRPGAARRIHWLVGGLILLAAVLAYLPGLGGPILFDDRPNLTANQLLHIDGHTLDDWRVASFSSGAGPLRRPVSMFTFAINHVVSDGLPSRALKVTNLAIHLLTGALIYYLVSLLARAPACPGAMPARVHWIALASAAVWLLHPLHVSTVLYAVQRMAQLATLFVVLGLIVYARYRQSWVERAATPGEIIAALLWLLLLTGLASLSKENGVLLLWLVVVVEVSLYRGHWNGRPNRWLAGTAWLVLLCPVFLALVVFIVQPEFFTGPYRRRPFDFDERVLTQGRMLWHYVRWLLLPDIRAMGFQHDDIAISTGWLQPVTTLVAFLSWGLLLAVSLLCRKRYPLLLFAVLFYLVGHAMESSVFALEMVYEHRNYLPVIGICMLLGAGLARLGLWRGTPDGRLLLGAVLGVLVLLLLIRSHTWSDLLLMTRTNVENHPGSPRAQFFYGDALVSYHNRRGELSLSDDQAVKVMVAARQQFLKMYEIAPQDIASQVMLYIIDTRYFPELPSRADWLTILESNLRGRVLQPSDYAAITSLIKYGIENGPKEDGPRLLNLLTSLMQGGRASKKLMLDQYKFLLATGAPVGERLELLESMLRASPARRAAQYYRALEYAESGDVGAAYRSVGDWLARDRKRWHLPLIKPLFQVVPEP